MQHPIAQFLAAQRALVIDGGLSTALEAKGLQLNDPLWTARVLLEAPERIREVHYDYYCAGANIAITATYQASLDGFARRGLDKAAALRAMRHAVELAKSARDQVLAERALDSHHLLVAGSVGPYGAYLANGAEYRGDYQRSRQALRDFHAPRMDALKEAGVDLLAVETQPKGEEIALLVEMAAERDLPLWVTMTLNDAGNALPDGTPLRSIAQLLESALNVEAAGFNCVRREQVAPALAALRAHTAKPLIVYPNGGRIWNAELKRWEGEAHEHPAGWAHYVPLWSRCGARLIGGCCCTLPRDIQQIAELLAQDASN